MRIALFALLFATVSVPNWVSGQERREAEKIWEYTITTNEALRASLDVWLQDIGRRKEKGRLLILVWGDIGQIERERRLTNYYVKMGGYDPVLIEFRVAGSVSPRKTEFWLVPAGAEPPEIKPEAWIAAEFGRVYKKDAVKKILNFFEGFRKLGNHEAYIINYGTPAQVALRERWIRDNIKFRIFDPWRITLVNGGPGPVRTVMWLVPPGAEIPKP